MKFSVVAILALGVSPAYSLSYLETLTSAAPNIAAAVPAPAAEAPFFFTNGAKDEPADSPAFFFTNGSTDAPAKVTGSYLDNLSGASSSSSGAGITSYLDALPKSSPSSGAGITSYLDALPKSTISSSGPGLQSYAATLNAAAAPVVPVTPAAPAAPSPASSSSVPAAVAGSNTSYLEALGGGATAPSGAGIMSYTDALVRSSAVAGGAGIASYVNALAPSNIASGPGLTSYTDALSPTSASSKSYSPFGAAKSTSSFAIGSITGKFVFTLEADADLIEKLAAAGDGRVTLKGKIKAIA